MVTSQARIGDEGHGERLDRVLVSLFSLSGLRTARRMIQDNAVLLNDKAATPGKRVKQGDKLEIKVGTQSRQPEIRAEFIGKKQDFLFLYKPAGLHTVKIAGRYNESLESQLPFICPDLHQKITLLQRLDRGTSGLICASLNEAGAIKYRLDEKNGLCEKRYLAILDGELGKKITVKNILQGNGKKRVHISAKEAEERYWTEFHPVWTGRLPGFSRSVTLADCILKSGQRHQVRAHASACGYPLVGDPLYGRSRAENFLLEHYFISFPGLWMSYIDRNSFFRRWFSGSFNERLDPEHRVCGL